MRLDRHLGGRLLGAFFLALAALSALVFVLQLFRLGHRLAGASLQWKQAALFVLLSSPLLIARLTPFALFAAISLMLRRMSQRGELTAVYGLGWSPLRLALPLLVAASIASAVGVAGQVLAQRTTPLLKQTALRAATQASLLRPREFRALDQRTVSYLERANPQQQRGQGLFVAQGLDRLLFAQRVSFSYDAEQRLRLALADVEIHQRSGDGRGYRRVRLERLELTPDTERIVGQHFRFLEQGLGSPLLLLSSCGGLALIGLIFGVREAQRLRSAALALTAASSYLLIDIALTETILRRAPLVAIVTLAVWQLQRHR